jgi:ATP-dependent DNA ligase
LTAKKMADCRWLKPVLVGNFEFVEWTGDNHLRHTKFVALRDDKDARQVVKE